MIDNEDEPDDAYDLILELRGGAEDVGIILVELSDAEESVELSAFLGHPQSGGAVRDARRAPRKVVSSDTRQRAVRRTFSTCESHPLVTATLPGRSGRTVLGGDSVLNKECSGAALSQLAQRLARPSPPLPKESELNSRTH